MPRGKAREGRRSALAYRIVYSEKLEAHHAHTHINYEVLYVREGQVTMFIRNRPYPAQAGDLIFLNQFDEHSTRLSGQTYRRYYLLIPPNELRAFHHDVRLLSVFRMHGAGFPYVLSTGEAKPRFDRYFELLLGAADWPSDYRDTRIEALLTLLLTDAVSLRPDMFISADGMSILPIRQILEELDTHFTEAFSLEELARRYHVSPGCLSAHFRAMVGVSPMQYITQSRLTLAKHMLLNTELPVNEIARQCGFGDTSNFVRRFHRQFECAPLHFRLQNRQSQTEPIARDAGEEEERDT